MPSLWKPHIEGDEIVYTFLAEGIRQHPLRYTLRQVLEGEPAIRFINDTWAHLYAAEYRHRRARTTAGRLPTRNRADLLRAPFEGTRSILYDPVVYDWRLFFHPPVYAYALAAFRTLFGSAGAPLLSMLAHALSIVLVARLARDWSTPRTAQVAAGLTAIDPVSWLCGARVWMDGLAALMVVASILSSRSALTHRTTLRYFIAGAICGFTCLTKLPTIFMFVPIVAMLCLARRNVTTRQILIYAIGPGALVTSWLLLTRIVNGVWVVDVRPTPLMVEHSLYLQSTMNRPWHYYLSGTLLAAPIYIFSIWSLMNRLSSPGLLISASWVLSFLGGLTILGVSGHGFQLRFLAPAMPALCILTAEGITGMPKWASFAVLLGAITFLSGLYPSGIAGLAEPIAVVVRWIAAL